MTRVSPLLFPLDLEILDEDNIFNVLDVLLEQSFLSKLNN